MTNKELGDNIRKIRELRGFTQQNLADELHIDQKTISRVEQGEISPKFDLVVKIAKALNVKLSALLNFNKDLIFNNIVNTQQGGHFVAYNNTEIEKVEELYKELLKQKDEMIAMLKHSKK
ncbi:MAG: helix-turn-helix domain-containing protein [Crocinitomicaceae bacterium]|nr:helix-turn-helix domain-containing protein [Crocinitomicaceae bacterium]